MNMQETLNIQRLFHLIINDLKLHIKPIVIVAAVLAIFSPLMFFHPNNNLSSYFMILYIGGFIITSFAFADLHNYQKACSILTLPCSNLERFLNKWFLTSIGYAIAVFVMYYLLALLNHGIFFLIFHQKIPTMTIFQTDLWVKIGKYIILQSIVLFGAITFKRYALIKTILALGVSFFVLGLVCILIFLLFFYNYSQPVIHHTLLNNYFIIFLSTIFWIFLAPFFWYLTYLRLTEFELI
jgi:hypothetical protein